MNALRTLVEGLHFPEAPRWREGRLWFSDFYHRKVFAASPDGTLETIAEVPASPSGLGWLPGGALLVVSMDDRKLLKLERGALSEAADLSAHAGASCNDMVVDAAGRAWIGNFGFDALAGQAPRPTVLLRVDPDASVHVAADGLLFPNGSVVAPDGRTLIVAETFGHRLTAFTIAGDGSLHERRTWAALDGVWPDGICLDAAGAVWVADAMGRRVLRVAEGGAIVETVPTGARHAYACMLGGADGRTLFVCTAPGLGNKAATQREGRIEWTRAEVPHAGWP